MQLQMCRSCDANIDGWIVQLATKPKEARQQGTESCGAFQKGRGDALVEGLLIRSTLEGRKEQSLLEIHGITSEALRSRNLFKEPAVELREPLPVPPPDCPQTADSWARRSREEAAAFREAATCALPLHRSFSTRPLRVPLGVPCSRWDCDTDEHGS